MNRLLLLLSSDNSTIINNNNNNNQVKSVKFDLIRSYTHTHIVYDPSTHPSYNYQILYRSLYPKQQIKYCHKWISYPGSLLLLKLIKYLLLLIIIIIIKLRFTLMIKKKKVKTFLRILFLSSLSLSLTKSLLESELIRKIQINLQTLH